MDVRNLSCHLLHKKAKKIMRGVEGTGPLEEKNDQALAEMDNYADGRGQG